MIGVSTDSGEPARDESRAQPLQRRLCGHVLAESCLETRKLQPAMRGDLTHCQLAAACSHQVLGFANQPGWQRAGSRLKSAL